MSTLAQGVRSEVVEEVTEIRHDLHRHPELGYQEERTTNVVQNFLKQNGVEFVNGLADGTGVLAFIPADSPTSQTKTVALRADMDALPIHEETGLPYASQTPGLMHACGHDGHTSILLGAAKTLANTPGRRNNALLIFQPAEEGGAGASKMCRDGALDGAHFPAADCIYGLHGMPFLRQGQFGVKDGPLMAAADHIDIEIKGAGGHAAMPNKTQDVVYVAAQMIEALQSIVSRNVSPTRPAVVTIAAIEAGRAFNVIPSEVKMGGTVRTFDEETRALIHSRLKRIVSEVAVMHDCQASLNFADGYPATINDPWATDRFRSIARPIIGEDQLLEMEEPVMGAEDFSFYGRHVPATFFFVGLIEPGQESHPNVHTPLFDFKDAVIADCIRTMCALALEPVMTQ